MITAGVDAGSRATKVVVFDSAAGKIVAAGVADQGIEQERIARDLLSQAGANGESQAERVVATGYGRGLIRFAQRTVTEITCHARGVRHLAPGTRTIIEVGGQDSKVIALDPGGAVRDFAMNDRCAAGSGRFLEMLANRFQVSVGDIQGLCRTSGNAACISSMCVVFAETEIVGLLAQGVPPGEIAAGVQNSIASRVAALAGRMIVPPVCFTGGVALVPGMVDAMARALGCPVVACATPQFTGALGAALLAAETN
jgi:predicted CoA-substrate-specific enzyme activase